ncbi:MAG: SirB1 family protein [Gammaproteobacteria bacterium]
MKYTDTTVNEAFKEEVAHDEANLSLARAGLVFAQVRYPDIDCSWYGKQLDIVAEEILKRLAGENSGSSKLRVTVEYLFEELGYQGNAQDYYDPRNSFINEVIERRLGIPISLSVILLEVASKVGLSANGVAFPGHFLVRVDNAGTDSTSAIIVDAFDGGTSLGIEMFIARFRKRMEQAPNKAAVEQLLAPASKRDILIRQFRNLLAIYSNRRSPEDCLYVVNHILHLNPNLLNELIHRGRLLFEMGHNDAAIQDYERALLVCEDDSLKYTLETALRDAKSQRKPLH